MGEVLLDEFGLRGPAYLLLDSIGLRCHEQPLCCTFTDASGSDMQPLCCISSRPLRLLLHGLFRDVLAELGDARSEHDLCMRLDS